jgi:hypothetical protein
VGSTIIAIFVRRMRLASGFWGETPILCSSNFFSLACFSADAIAASEGAVSADAIAASGAVASAAAVSGGVAAAPAASAADAALLVPRSLETVPQAASTRLAAMTINLASMVFPAATATLAQPMREFKPRLHRENFRAAAAMPSVKM